MAKGMLDVTGRNNATVPTNVASKKSDAPSNAAAVLAGDLIPDRSTVRSDHRLQRGVIELAVGAAPQLVDDD